MHILDLAAADGLAPKKITLFDVEQHCCLCPGCRGAGTLIIWEQLDCYHCRQCGRRGDLIQYLRDFHGLSYKEACGRLGLALPGEPHTALWRPLPSLNWTRQITNCHKRLMKTYKVLDVLFKMGFTLGTIEHFQIGWNPAPKSVDRKRDIKIGRGEVVPAFDLESQQLLRIVVYQNVMNRNGVTVAGSSKGAQVFGEPGSKPVVVLEHEIDAILLQQFAGDICCPLALGNDFKYEDMTCHKLLREAPLILFGLDIEGISAALFRSWQRAYPHCTFWPFPTKEIPAAPFNKGNVIRKWLLEGIRDMLEIKRDNAA